MSSIPTNLKYTKDHEWLNAEDPTKATIGITDHAQDSLGDITFVELPEVGTSMEKGEAFGVVESVKAASDLFMPASGEIIEINEELLDGPEKVNESPYQEGWMIKIRIDGATLDSANLMSAEEYSNIVGEES